MLIIVVQNVLMYKSKTSAYFYPRSCRVLLNIGNLANVGKSSMFGVSIKKCSDEVIILLRNTRFSLYKSLF